MNRRRFLAAAGAAVVASATPAAKYQTTPQTAPGKARFRTGLVAYSYGPRLQAKTMTYEDLIRIAVETGIDGLEMTVYWLPSTADDYLASLRRLAYKNGVDIYGIGTRVQLANPAGGVRDKHLADLRQWVDVAQKLGASYIRVFANQRPSGATLEQAIGFAAETLKTGAEYAGARGIVLGLEDDGGITEFAKETIEIIRQAASPWAGMNLDTGNLRPPKVYDQIEMSIPYAVGTHIKPTVALDDGSGRAPVDFDRMYGMFAKQGYRGYMGLEHDAADPAEVPRYLRQMKEMAGKYSA